MACKFCACLVMYKFIQFFTFIFMRTTTISVSKQMTFIVTSSDFSVPQSRMTKLIMKLNKSCVKQQINIMCFWLYKLRNSGEDPTYPISKANTMVIDLIFHVILSGDNFQCHNSKAVDICFIGQVTPQSIFWCHVSSTSYSVL